jgi:excisionase family DNA binding protein
LYSTKVLKCTQSNKSAQEREMYFMRQMLSIKEASDVMGVHPRTVLRMIEDGKLEASKVGRVWRIAPGAINALTGQPVVKNGGGAAVAVGGSARRVAVAVLAEALPIVKAYCAATGKSVDELTTDDLDRMV